MPRRPRRLGRHAPPSARAPHVAVGVGPVGGLRGLVEEGIVTVAALNARDDLELAAASTQRLGALSSGMWRALSRELATAAERLDRSTMDRMDDIERRARSLHVEADQVVAAGVAAAHLAEHRETLETLVQPDQDARRFLEPNMLYGFSIDAHDAETVFVRPQPEEETGDTSGPPDDDDEVAPGSVLVTLYLWPAPLTPASVLIAPSIPGGTDGSFELKDVALDLGLSAPDLLLDALSLASKLPADAVNRALPALAVACWTAHHLDEVAQDEDEEEEDIDDDVEGDGGPVGIEGV